MQLLNKPIQAAQQPLFIHALLGLKYRQDAPRLAFGPLGRSHDPADCARQARPIDRVRATAARGRRGFPRHRGSSRTRSSFPRNNRALHPLRNARRGPARSPWARAAAEMLAKATNAPASADNRFAPSACSPKKKSYPPASGSTSALARFPRLKRNVMRLSIRARLRGQFSLLGLRRQPASNCTEPPADPRSTLEFGKGAAKLAVVGLDPGRSHLEQPVSAAASF